MIKQGKALRVSVAHHQSIILVRQYDRPAYEHTFLLSTMEKKQAGLAVEYADHRMMVDIMVKNGNGILKKDS